MQIRNTAELLSKS